MYSTIERKLKNRQIYTPAGYVEVCTTARQTLRLYVVNYLSYDKLSSYLSIRPGQKLGDLTVTDIWCLKYGPSGKIEYKLKFSDKWEALQRRMSNIPNSFKVPPLYSSPLKIRAEKFAHLQQLKLVLPKGVHTFYDTLPHICNEKTRPCQIKRQLKVNHLTASYDYDCDSSSNNNDNNNKF